jgi:hypothetical protein
MSLRAVLLGLAVLALVVAACGDGVEDTTGLSLKCPSKEAPEPAQNLSSVSLDQVYERMAESMACPGYALRVSSVGREEFGGGDEDTFASSIQGTTWMDLRGQRARYETWSRLGYASPAEQSENRDHEDVREVAIVLRDAGYWAQTDRGPPEVFHPVVCHGSRSPILSLLLGCAGYTEDSVTRFEPDAERHGPALETEGEISWPDGSAAFTQALHLDQATLLPWSGTSQSTEDDGDSESGQASHEYDLVPLDSLPTDFFDPEAIGYAGSDPEQKLRGVALGVDVHWLGVEFPGGDGLPALTLESAYPLSPPPDWILPRYRAMVEYRLAGDEFASGAVDLELYPRAEWDAYARESGEVALSGGPCAQDTELKLADRRAMIAADYDIGQLPNGCPQRPPDLWVAYVYFGDTVVLVRAPGHREPGVGEVASPYASREGMEAVVRGLVLRPAD